MKILFFLESFKLGGVEKSLIDLLNSTDKSNSITICLWGNDNQMLEAGYLPSNINIIHSFNIKRFIKNDNVLLNKMLRYLNALFLSIRLAFSKYDKVVNYHYAANWRCSLFKFNCKKHIAVYHEGIIYNECFSEKMCHRIDEFCFISPKTFNEVLEKFNYLEKKSRLIYNIINENDLIHKSKEFKIDNKCFTIVTCGRLSEIKGYSLAIAAADLLKNNIKFKWRFVGDGEEFENLCKTVIENGLEDYIIFDGFQSNPYPYIKSADVYVQPSKSESFGLTVTEALILKRVVICTENIPNPFIVAQKTALVCRYEATDLAEKIMTVYNNKTVAEDLKKSVSGLRFERYNQETLNYFFS